MWNMKMLAVLVIATGTSLAGTAWYAYSKGRQSGMQEVQTLWIAERAAIREAQAEEMMKASQREEALKALLARQRKEHRNEVDRIVREYSALADSLRDRPERPAESAGGVPENPDAGTGPAAGCTGAQLYRPDSVFLAGEAARADQLRVALAACIAHAAEVERQLNGAFDAKQDPQAETDDAGSRR